MNYLFQVHSLKQNVIQEDLSDGQKATLTDNKLEE